MKALMLLLCLFPAVQYGQNVVSMNDVEQKPSLSMSQVNGKTQDGMYRYYAKGTDQPFTGVLYSTFPNGQFDSWQEYKDGVGQGKWINYYENGNYREIGNYEQNKVVGPIQKFYENGQLKAEGTYKDWRIWVGEWKFYNENGSLVETKDFGTKGSTQEVEAFYARGDISYAWYSRILRNNGFITE